MSMPDSYGESGAACDIIDAAQHWMIPRLLRYSPVTCPGRRSQMHVHGLSIRSHLNPMNWARYRRENPLSSNSTKELWGYVTVFTTSELVSNIPEIAAWDQDDTTAMKTLITDVAFVQKGRRLLKATATKTSNPSRSEVAPLVARTRHNTISHAPLCSQKI